MPAPRKYPDELKNRAIRLTLDALADPDRSRGCFRRVGDELGVNPETLRGWVRQARIDAGEGPGTTTEGARRIKELEKEVRELRRGRDPAERVGFLRGGARPPVPLICQYIDQRKEEFGVEPICTVLTESGCRIAPSTYYAARSRPPSKRSISDAAVDERILALRAEPFNAALGSRKTWRLLNAQDGRPPVARCTVERRMRALGLSGAAPGRKPRATGPAEGDRAPGDLLRRDSRRHRPEPQMGGRPAPTCRPGRGTRCTASVTGARSARRIVGWATSARTGHRQRGQRPGTRDPGAQGTRGRGPGGAGAPLRPRIQVTCPSPTPDDSSKRGPGASAGAVGSSYDNAAAEALNKSYKRELVWRDGPWKDRDDLETATAQWVNWYNRTRPHRANPDDLPPTTVEHRYHRNHTTTPPTTV